MNPITLVLPNDNELSMFPDHAKVEDKPYYKPGSRDIRNLPIAFAVYTRKILLALVGLLATYPENKIALFILKYILFVFMRFNFVIALDPDAKRNAVIMCWFSGSALGLTGAWVGIGGVALVHLALTIFLGRTFTQQLLELLGYISSVDNLDTLKIKEEIDRLLGRFERSEDPEYWKDKIEQLLRPNSKFLANDLNLNLKDSYSYLRRIDLISFTRLPFNQVWKILEMLLVLKQLEELEKTLERMAEFIQRLRQKQWISLPELKIEQTNCLNEKDVIQEITKKQLQLASIKASLIIQLNSRLNDSNNPMLQFIQVSKMLNDFSSSTTLKTSKKKFLKSRVSNLTSKISKIRPKITKLRLQIKVKNSKDFISSCLGYVSLVMAGLTTVFEQDYYKLERRKPLDNMQSGVRIERSIEEWQDWNSPQLTSKSNSKTFKVLLPGDYFGQPYILQGKSLEKGYGPDSTESPQFEIETFIEYEEEIPSASSSNPMAANGNNSIITSDPLVIDPIIIEIETDSGNSPININK